MNTSFLAWAQIIGSGFFGGVVSLILSPIVARQQIRQLEITYRQKLNDNFLQNTRQYIDTLYIPINKSLSKLEDSYQTYKRRKAHLESMMRGKVKILPSLSKKRDES